MNLAKQLEILGHKNWTIKGELEVSRPVPVLLFRGTENERMQTQAEADQAVLSRIEWNGIAPVLTWDDLANAYDYSRERREDYEKVGLTVEAWTLAIIQKDIDNDPAEFNRMKNLRAAIKTKFPKEKP